MDAATILNTERRKAGLSQRALADRTEIPQSSVSRIERGRISPTADTLERLLAACGSELAARPEMGEGLDVSLIRERLAMTPTERARRAVLEWKRTAPFRSDDANRA
jgi:transcriptional regulator with XRE-family HTH domain